MKLHLLPRSYCLYIRYQRNRRIKQGGLQPWDLNSLLVCLLLMINWFIPQQAISQTTDAGEKGVHTGVVFYQDSVLSGKEISYFLCVDKVLPNSPASKTELRRHDKLVNLNGIHTSTIKKDVSKMNAMMANITASSVYLEIDRTDETKKTKRIGYVIDLAPEANKVKSRVFGIGVTLSVDSIIVDDQIVYTAQVLGVYPNSPAEKFGVNPGDFIYMVDGIRIEGKSYEIINKVVDRLLVDEPTEVDVSFLRPINGDYKLMPYRMKRIDISYYLKNQILPVRTLNQTIPAPKVTSPKQPAEDALQPQHDKDRDGITDDDDACPDQPGVYSQNPFENGCPE